MIMWLSKDSRAAEIVVAFIYKSDDWVAAGEPVHFFPRGLDGINVEFIQLKLSVRVLRVGVQIQLQFNPVVSRQSLAGRVLK